MLRFQIALAIILVGCVAFISCDRGQQMLDPADMIDPSDDMSMKMPMDMMDYMSWMHVMLPAPPTEVTNPGESGSAHGMGTRTVYFNEAAAMANKDGTMYPAGSMIIKTIMDDANTFVAKKAVMTKSDDPMYAGHNGWMYAKYARASEDAEYMQVKGSNLEDAAMGCHGCHAKAGTEGASGHDSVFVLLPKDQMMGDTADEMPKSQMFEVTLMNLTMGEHGMSGQTLSPAIFVTHPAGFKIAEEGKPAPEELVAQAEGGKTDGLEALAATAGAHVTIGMNPDGTRRYTMPGQSTTVTVTADMMNASLSVSSMLVSTNDAFIAAFDVPLFDEAGMPVTKTIELMAYDAGSEDNTEKALDIPGPLGLDADTDPMGSNARVPTEGGVIMIHPGIQGGADVSEAFAWEGPVAKLMIMPVTDMNKETADSTYNASDDNADDDDQ